jgi:predicted helicase
MSQSFSAFETYLTALRRTPVDKKTEHTDRDALGALLQSLAEHGVKVQHEPKQTDHGAPDYGVTTSGMVVGYVETKQIGDNLDKVRKGEQIARYRQLSQNILLTDYLDFIWIEGETIHRARIAHESDVENRKFKLREESVAETAKLIQGFLSVAPEGIGRADTLALALATRSRLLHDDLAKELGAQAKAEAAQGKLYGLYGAFKAQVFHELTVSEFADAFAQMLAYGLFLAKLNAKAGETITLDNAKQFVPGSFRLIRELVGFLDELKANEYAEIRWVVKEILSIVNGLDAAAIHEDLAFKNRKARSRKSKAKNEEEERLFSKDPFIYFYEDYLAKYDKKLRKSRGVYYTPPPVVNFIVRAINDILKDTFGIKDGLADRKRVTVLDFATGTGTFLLEVFERIFETVGKDSGKAKKIVAEHLLKNIYGFEYLIAPYTIAHLKLSQYLEEQGHKLSGDERLQVFLTNTLEPVEAQRNLLLPGLTAEVEAAQAVKDKPILVITGNPPYAAQSRNRGAWITDAIEAYKLFDGVHFGEKKHWLHDDYVKFIRFAQVKMDAVDEGVVGIITNHSWLDNPTFRGMRQSLMRSFDQIHVLDLHGNAKKQETAPDGSKDENVFDIEQGVSISVFVKSKKAKRGIFVRDLWGSRNSKYEFLASKKIHSSAAAHIDPERPYLLFKNSNSLSKSPYSNFFELKMAFREAVAGIITARDHFAISIDRAELLARVEAFSRSADDTEALRREFGVRPTRGWDPFKARDALRRDASWHQALGKVLQAPFDHRWTILDERIVDWPRKSFFAKYDESSPGLVLPRKIDLQQPWRHAFVTSGVMTHHSISIKEVNYFFPLTYDDSENLAPAFRTFLDAKYDHHFTPEEVLGYMYAVLYAPAYRARYAEFLRIDFPRIPFPDTKAQFEKLSGLGWQLVQAHLLKEVPATKLGAYKGKGNDTVEAIRYAEADEAVWINETQRFLPVPRAVWDFHIGGYQVIEKYLKSRKGRTLSLDEIENVENVADVLAFTIAQMGRIDAAYRKAFPE